jgi:predicted RecA/RadA family phage recombinase
MKLLFTRITASQLLLLTVAVLLATGALPVDPAYAGVPLIGLASNFVQCGETIRLTAPYGRLSGEAALIGHLFGVALADVDSSAEVEWSIEGVWDLVCVSTDTPAQGDKLYWDDSAKKITTTSSANTYVGVCAVTKTSGPTTVRIRLNGIGF